MLENVKVIAFTILELLRENHQGWSNGGEGGGNYLPHIHTQIRVKEFRLIVSIYMTDVFWSVPCP